MRKNIIIGYVLTLKKDERVSQLEPIPQSVAKIGERRQKSGLEVMAVKRFIKMVCFVLLKIYYIFPVQNNKVFLMSFNGTAIGYDSKAFADWCLEQDKGIDFVWGVASNTAAKKLKHQGIRMVKICSLRGFYDILTAKALVFNINPPSYVPYRKNQVLVNTWHGYPFKKVGKYVTPLKEIHFNRATAFISHSEEYTQMCLEDSFEFQGNILKCGAPRNDIFFTDRVVEVKERIKVQYKAEKCNVALWMPTFRKDFLYRETDVDFARVIGALKTRFGGEWVVFARLHPSLVGKVQLHNDHFIDVSEHQDAQELLCAADVLISDYSSAMWDFSLLRRPVFIYADDVDSYMKDRGLYKPISQLPYIAAYSNDELESAILTFDREKYSCGLEQYFAQINCYETGESASVIFEYIFRKE